MYVVGSIYDSLISWKVDFEEKAKLSF